MSLPIYLLNESLEDFLIENERWHLNEGKIKYFISCPYEGSGRECSMPVVSITNPAKFSTRIPVTCQLFKCCQPVRALSVWVTVRWAHIAFLQLENSGRQNQTAKYTKAGFNPLWHCEKFKYYYSALPWAAGNSARLALILPRFPPSLGSAEGRVYRRSWINNSRDSEYRGPWCDFYFGSGRLNFVQRLWQARA